MENMARFRQLKKDMAVVLKRDNWRQALNAMNIAPDTKVNPLLALRLNPDELVCWRAIYALGEAVAELADTNIKQARIHMRTFMWFMNEESGNLGWGIPEAMACTMALSEKMAKEYHTILASYIYCDKECDGNFLDHPELRRGVFWGLGHLAKQQPEMVMQGMRFLIAGLSDVDDWNRGLAARAIGILASKGQEIPTEAIPALEALKTDTEFVRVYRNDVIEDTDVSSLAIEALTALNNQ